MADQRKHRQNLQPLNLVNNSNSHTNSSVSPAVSPLSLQEFPRVPQSNNITPLRLAVVRNSHDDLRTELSPSTTMYRTNTNVSRSGSVSSYSSAYTSTLPSTPTNVFPAPQYVAAFGAASVVSERKRRFSDDEFDDRSAVTPTPNQEDMEFSEKALVLVNGFLDQLLYSFLGNAKSTTLTALRPAVRDVLKSRLAAEAISSAEAELSELLAGGEEEEEEMNQRQSVAERARTWDTELVWKRTRLRVMVYTRLGEVEDDDEERYIRDDDLFHHSDRRFSHSSGLVSWAAAIFLTSVLEFIAERVLQVSGAAAESRIRRQSKNPRLSMSATGILSPLTGLTVEDHDVEKVALDSTLGRHWRTWRKSLRSNGASHIPATVGSNHNFSRRFSRDVPGRERTSFGPESVSALDDSREVVPGKDTAAEESDQMVPPEIIEEEIPEHILAANIPLPLMNEKRDVDEIEVPGLARDPDEDETNANQATMDPQPKRRNSDADFFYSKLQRMPGSFLATPDNEEVVALEGSSLSRHPSRSDQKQGTQVAGQRLESDSVRGDNFPVREDAARPILTRLRSTSVPTPVKRFAFPYSVITQTDDSKVDEDQSTDLPTAQTDDIEAEPQVDRKADQSAVDGEPDKSQKLNSALLESAGPGSAAAAAAAAASLVYGSRLDKKEARKSLPANGLGLQTGDSQKHLVEVKRMSMPLNGLVHEGQLAKRVSVSAPHTPATLVTTRSVENLRSPSTEGVTTRPNNGRQMSEGAVQTKEQKQEPPVDIGVAKTSDNVVSALKKQEDRHYHARDSFTNPAPRRQSRLILGTSSPEAPSSSALKENTTVGEQAVAGTTPESFLSKRSLSVSPKVPQTSAKSQIQRPEHPSQTGQKQGLQPDGQSILSDSIRRNNTPMREDAVPGTQQQPLNANPERVSSASATSEKGTPRASHAKQSSSESPAVVQEHPVVQKMAVKKKKDTRVNQEEEKFPLTSASIKGPEDFEMFVQGGDTVKYTLTPENVRDVSVNTTNDHWSPVPADLRQTPPNTVPLAQLRAQAAETTKLGDNPQRPPSRAGRSQVAKATTSTIIPVPPEPMEDDSAPKKERPRSISRPPVRNTSVHRKSGLMAREPQVQTESTRDFADFIRSTGPDKEQEIYPILNNRSTASLHSLRQAHINGSRSSSPGGASVRSQNRLSMKNGSVPPLPPMPRRKSDMQPRAPTSSGDDGTSALIDFIRTGPNANANVGASQEGQQREHRISRSVAPFRTTMDSDQLTEWGDRIAAQPDLKLNTSVAAAPSVRSASSLPSTYTNRTSANSKSALLNSGSNTFETSQPAYSGQQQRLSAGTRNTNSAGPEPTVKRYRNKDPYAIDFDDDDEDDDFLTALPKGKREEESLIDFLRSTGPSDAAKAAMAKDKLDARGPPLVGPRRSSAPGFKAAGANAVSIGRAVTTPNQSARPSISNEATPKSTTTTVAIGPISNPRQRLEARGGSKDGGNGTGDLADFLRTSGPAEPPRNIRQISSHGKTGSILSSNTKASSASKSRKSGFWSGLFSRKPAPAAGKGYLDM